VIVQIAKTFKRHKNSKLAECVGEEEHITFVDENDYLVLEKSDKHKGRN